MSTESRRRTWLVYDAKRKATAERKLKERARTIVRGMMRRGEIWKSGRCRCCERPRQTVWHHPDYNEPRRVIELCKPCHRHHHPRGGFEGDDLSLCRMYTRCPHVPTTHTKLQRCRVCVEHAADDKRAFANMRRAYSRKALRASKIV